MQYRKLGDSDLQCSVIGLGGWGFADSNWAYDSDEQSIELIQKAIEAGINFLDTAPPYGGGKSEQLMGQAMKDFKREELIVADKCGAYRKDGKPTHDWRPEVLRSMLAQSLKDLDTEYIDLYQMHWPSDTAPISEAFTQMNAFIKDGRVRYVGVSNFSPEQMKQAAQYCPIVSLQPPYSLLDRGIEEDIVPYCVEHNIGIVSYGSIAAGALSGKHMQRPVFPEGDPRNRFYAAYYSEENWPKTAAMVDVLRAVAEKHNRPVVQVAINWVLAQKGMTVAIVGARTAEQVQMNAAAGEWSLAQEDVDIIQQAYDKVFA